MQTNIDLGNELVSGILAEGTKKQYELKIGHFKTWIKNNYNYNWNDAREEVDIPVGDDVLKAFFAHICRKTHRETKQYLEPPQYNSVSYVGAYKSALRYYYKKFDVRMSVTTVQMLEDLVGGFTRKVATLKQQGVISLTEGKMPLPYAAYQLLAQHTFSQNSDFMSAGFCSYVFNTCMESYGKIKFCGIIDVPACQLGK